jgi:Ca-activated chloride channel family protein
MKFTYYKWDEELFRRLRSLSDLMAIFQYLLLRLGGNVEATLRLMRSLQEKGVISADYDIDEFERQLKDSRIVNATREGLSLSAAGERLLRKEAFEQMFDKLRASGKGDHLMQREGGASDEPLPETRKYMFGDNPRHIDYTSSLFNSITRSADLGLNMVEDDLEVFESERSSSCATVLLIDISHSMILYGEDRITPAKQVAMALTELILTKYRRDDLTVVLFGDDAKEIKISDLPYVTAGPYHTNTQAGLRLGRQILMGKKHVNRQIFMVTDGKPSMITRPNGEIYKNPMGLDPRIVNRTLDEAVICRKKKITITTFMVTDDPYLQDFVERLTELNRGRAYFSSVDNLGSFVLWDFVANRKKKY